jgi:sulfur-oxidizing protein SoxY
MAMRNISGLARRDLLLAAGGVALGMAGIGTSRPVRADLAGLQAALKGLVGDKPMQEGKVTLTMPEIAENGNTVPLEVAVDSPMTEADYVKAVHILAEGNPSPDVASFYFTPASGKAAAATRMRLASTQNVVAVAEMSDGSLFSTKRDVKVTIGGCGG